MTEFINKELWKGRRDYQDSVFRLLFSDKKSAIELYNALEGTNYGPDVDFEFTTLDNAVYAGLKNDLGFKIAEKYVVLTEHQSTINMNMAVRHLQYLGRTYETQIESDLLYKKGQVKVPTPEFFVLYTGEEEWDVEYLKLSDSFMEKPPENSAELVVKVINVRYNKDKYNEVLAHSEKLRGYSILLDYVHRYRKEIGDISIAISLAVKRCIEEGILKDFLTKHSSEVGSMLFHNISIEEFAEIRAQEACEEMEEKVREKVREEIQEEVREEIQEEVREEIQEKVREEIQEKVREEVREEIRKETVTEMIEKFIIFCREQKMSEEEIKKNLSSIYELDGQTADLYLHGV